MLSLPALFLSSPLLLRASPHFPRQPLLPPSVHLTVREEDTRAFTRTQLETAEERTNSSVSPDQADWGYFEGDIVGVSVEWNNGRVIVGTNLEETLRASCQNAWLEKVWPGGRVAYKLSSSFTQWQRNVIEGAISEIECSTCVRDLQK